MFNDEIQNIIRKNVMDATISTSDRWWKWNVLQKAKKMLGPVYTKNSGFKADYHELIDEVTLVAEF